MRPWIKELWQRYEDQKREVDYIFEDINMRYKDILEKEYSITFSEEYKKRYEEYRKEYDYWKRRQHNHEDFYFWIVDKMTDEELNGESDLQP